MSPKKKDAKILPFVTPKKFTLGLPVGTQAFQTFLIVGEPPGLESSSKRKMIAAGEAEVEAEREHRGEPDKALPKEKKKIWLPEELAELSTYPTNDGRFYHPAMAFLSAALDGLWAARAIYPNERESASNILARSLDVRQMQCILVDPVTHKAFRWGKKKDILHPPYVITLATPVNNITGFSILNWQAVWPKWATFVTFCYDPMQASPESILQALELGGRLVAVGGFRKLSTKRSKRGKGGPFGKYIPYLWNRAIPQDAIPEV